MMNRVFHARIVAAQYVALGLMAFIMIWGFWYKELLIAVVFMLLLVVCIERLIHTSYTLSSDGKLVLCRGRFTRIREIDLKDIVAVEQISFLKIGRWVILHYVLVKYRPDKCEVFLPVNEEEFICALKKRIQEITHV
ncbi:membrane protein containing DUF1200 [gut metagenome]|uniref:Membrane protein containing DUF1200 n=1 Tax=gut metagenome TaxID=749906 RepID=J9GFI2_9ZZZZ